MRAAGLVRISQDLTYLELDYRVGSVAVRFVIMRVMSRVYCVRVSVNLSRSARWQGIQYSTDFIKGISVDGL